MRRIPTVPDAVNRPDPSATTLGLDLGDRRSHVCVLDPAGAVVERFVIESTAAAMGAVFAPRRGALVVMEAGGHSPWVSRLMTALGLRVIVANPNKLAALTRSDRKTDRNDAEMLARLGRADLKLLRPLEHRSASRQAHLEMLKARDALVRSRTLQVNHVRGALKAFGVRAPSCDASTFASKAREHVPEELRQAIEPLLGAIALLTKSIRGYDRLVECLCQQAYPETALLRQVQGVGSLTSLAFVLVLGSAERFRHSRQVGPYLGLVPRAAQSGEQDPQLHITKAGNGFMRKLLVQAAHYITGPFGEDSTLRRVGLHLMASGGTRAKKRAIIAVARRLAVLLHCLWKTGETYDRLRHARVAIEPVAAVATTD